MEWLKTFSTDYANGVTAFAAVCALLFTLITLWYLKREYSSKYRPYVIPVVHAEQISDKLGCVVTILPTNIGSHPCKVKLSEIKLTIGDEAYNTPETRDWLTIAPHGVSTQMPAGHVNEKGVKNIREGRYKKNRIELSFLMKTISIEDKFEESRTFIYEINVLGEKPLSLFRPEWSTDA
jgi:hypothetical protein